MRTLLKVALLVALIGACGGGYYLYRQDQEYRQLYGRVTPVSVFNWVAEVEKHKDNLPVLLYFHNADQTPEQRAIVEKFAWNQAGKVKVVSIDVDRPENLLFAVRYAVLRQPGFVIIFKDGQPVRGYDGGISKLEDLQRLLHEAQQQK